MPIYSHFCLDQEQPRVRCDAVASPARGQRRQNAAALRGGQAEDELDAPAGPRLWPHRARRGGAGGQQPGIQQPAQFI